MNELSEAVVVTRSSRMTNHQNESDEKRHAAQGQQRDACRFGYEERGQDRKE
jgi:hypothetical protein